MRLPGTGEMEIMGMRAGHEFSCLPGRLKPKALDMKRLALVEEPLVIGVEQFLALFGRERDVCAARLRDGCAQRGKHACCGSRGQKEAASGSRKGHGVLH